MDDWEDDDAPPFADPAIRKDYELALGRLILAHNEVDYLLTGALNRVVERLTLNDHKIKYAQGKFDTRLGNLELFQKIRPDSGVAQIDIDCLRRLNKVRNDVAHGHFEQNLYDGSYELLGNGRETNKRARNYTTAELDKATEDLRSLAGILRAHKIFGDFPRTYILPPDATLA